MGIYADTIYVVVASKAHRHEFWLAACQQPKGSLRLRFVNAVPIRSGRMRAIGLDALLIDVVKT
jgi:hypothetical protein